MIAYLTNDEVNAALARRMAARLDLDLTVLMSKEADLAAAADLMIVDLDHLPAECKSRLLERVGRGKLRGVAVHSYNLSPEEIRALRKALVAVTRRLTAKILVPRTTAKSV